MTRCTRRRFLGAGLATAASAVLPGAAACAGFPAGPAIETKDDASPSSPSARHFRIRPDGALGEAVRPGDEDLLVSFAASPSLHRLTGADLLVELLHGENQSFPQIVWSRRPGEGGHESAPARCLLHLGRRCDLALRATLRDGESVTEELVRLGGSGGTALRAGAWSLRFDGLPVLRFTLSHPEGQV